MSRGESSIVWSSPKQPQHCRILEQNVLLENVLLCVKVLLKIPFNMISLIAFVACLTAAHACTCEQPSVEQAFCNKESDIVTWARVMSINGDLEKPEQPWEYTIWHLRTWKGYEKVKDNSTSILTTSSKDADCGLTGLVEEWDYILEGKMEGDKIKITSCNLALPYYQVTPEDMGLLSDLKNGDKKCEVSKN
ncbi:hypothetical protein Y032_0828g2559 [Ancylostoma ceylanicum]|uniref:NTR domain-containing protein n=1 Tax=Ancylostoma ceylanicum TaxID=53326 RepID=A0A016WDN0_9BILA|nr:hypothetical protein Y032_0828g2559 [Ancylostoma ceylanicum]